MRVVNVNPETVDLIPENDEDRKLLNQLQNALEDHYADKDTLMAPCTRGPNDWLGLWKF